MISLLYIYFFFNLTSNTKILYGEATIRNSKWWSYNDSYTSCITSLTGCPVTDLICLESFELRQLFKGPFKSKVKNHIYTLIHGLKFAHKKDIISSPFCASKRLDLAIHLRNQFSSFEPKTRHQNHSHDEASMWINSTECKDVFQLIRTYTFEAVRLLTSVRKSSDQPFVIFIAADNKDVKKVLLEYLKRDPKLKLQSQIVTIIPEKITHISNIPLLSGQAKFQGMLGMFLDWYFMALADRFLTWRSNTHRSSLSETAAFMSYRNYSSVNQQASCPKLKPSRDNSSHFIHYSEEVGLHLLPLFG